MYATLGLLGHDDAKCAWESAMLLDELIRPPVVPNRFPVAPN